MNKLDQQKLLSMSSKEFYLWMWKNKNLSINQKIDLGKWYEKNKNTLSKDIDEAFDTST